MERQRFQIVILFAEVQKWKRWKSYQSIKLKLLYSKKGKDICEYLFAHV